jgi:hypothetical protein
MKPGLPTVSSEGGPILIGDLERVRKWRGVDETGTSPDYLLACNKVRSSAFANIDDSLLVWNFGGPGTGFLVRTNEMISFIRVWANEEVTDHMIIELTRKIEFSPAENHLRIFSGTIVFLWAPEDGRSIAITNGDSGVPSGDFCMDGTAFFMKVGQGVFGIESAASENGDLQFKALRMRPDLSAATTLGNI